MTDAETTRELVYKTNRDVKWICRALARMEAQNDEFENRIRTLEGWRAEEAEEGDHHDQRQVSNHFIPGYWPVSENLKDRK